MVISPQSTLFVGQLGNGFLRPDVDSKTPKPNPAPEALREQRNDVDKQEESPRPVLETVSSQSANYAPTSETLLANSTRFEQEPNEEREEALISRDAPDQFDKVQTFLQIQSFDKPFHLIDTFV